MMEAYATSTARVTLSLTKPALLPHARASPSQRFPLQRHKRRPARRHWHPNTLPVALETNCDVNLYPNHFDVIHRLTHQKMQGCCCCCCALLQNKNETVLPRGKEDELSFSGTQEVEVEV
jgi:hypothetical protein